MANWWTLYWLVVGALFGLGVISILSIGVILLALGIVLLIFGALRLGGRGLWAGVVGFGLAPALLLVWDVTSWPRACISNHPIYSPVIPAGSPAGTTYRSPNYFQCVQTPAGTYTSYHVLAAIFGVIALLGLLLGVALYLRGRHHRDGGLSPI